MGTKYFGIHSTNEQKCKTRLVTSWIGGWDANLNGPVMNRRRTTIQPADILWHWLGLFGMANYQPKPL